MNTDSTRVIVTEYDCNTCSVPTVQVQHERFPELRIADASVAKAAERLANRLADGLEVVSLPSRREVVRQAIEDVREFLVTHRDPSPPVHASR